MESLPETKAVVEEEVDLLDLLCSDEGCLQPGATTLCKEIEKEIATLKPDGVIIMPVKGPELMAFLTSTEIYVHNRQVDKDRAKKLSEIYRAELKATGMIDLRSAVIFVGLAPTPGRRELSRVFLDGGHRRAALRILTDEIGSDFFAKVHAFLWLKHCRTRDDLDTEFFKINCGTPVPAAYYSQQTAAVVNIFVDAVTADFPDHERDGKTAQRPYFRRRDILDSITGTPSIRDAIIDRQITSADLHSAFLQLNEVKKQEFTSMSAEKRKRQPAKMIERITSDGFYIGMEAGKDWAYRVGSAALVAARVRTSG